MASAIITAEARTEQEENGQGKLVEGLMPAERQGLGYRDQP